jgi:hypothetical protein
LELTSPTNGGCLVGIVCSWTQATEFSLMYDLELCSFESHKFQHHLFNSAKSMWRKTYDNYLRNKENCRSRQDTLYLCLFP